MEGICHEKHAIFSIPILFLCVCVCHRNISNLFASRTWRQAWHVLIGPFLCYVLCFIHKSANIFWLKNVLLRIWKQGDLINICL